MRLRGTDVQTDERTTAETFASRLRRGYNYHSSSIRLQFDHSTTYVTIGLLHADLNK